MNKIKWGILSTANIGKEQVIPSIQRSENGEVYAVASRGGDKAEKFADELGIPHAYSSYEELIADTEIDAVYIPLPNKLHKEWVIKAAKQGKHVLCEKPAALTAADLKEMFDVCEENNVIFMEAFMYQFHPQHEKVQELLSSNTIGKVGHAHASFSFVLDTDADPTNIRLNKELGGGVLYDAGCYTVHSLCNILNETPVQVYARAKQHPEFKIDTTVVGVLSFASGIEASFDTSFEAAFKQSYQLFGKDGTVKASSPYRPDVVDDGKGVIQVENSDGTKEHRIDGDQYKIQAEHFANCIIEKKQPSYSKQHMMDHARVLDACFESINTGNSVKLS
ncbi:Gfo/Idh/MocA family protein [Salipaludibacillus sp. HK11]|uniref:Gfo/Idh/MocA family protein n=1 Tax=Salipaludibacillus sp. HK11 TaxID=3394320 RepID=UPI0039FD1387